MLDITQRANAINVQMQGMNAAGKGNLGMLQRQDLAAAAPVKQILEAPRALELMEILLQVSKHPAGAPVCLLRFAYLTIPHDPNIMGRLCYRPTIAEETCSHRLQISCVLLLCLKSDVLSTC